jgi:hypothetical protein
MRDFFEFMSFRRRVLLLALAIAIAAAVSAWLWLRPYTPDQDGDIGHQIGGVAVTHAAIGDEKGCATCHAEAIPYTTCSDAGCHDPLASPYQITPTTMVINFPHHDTENSVGAPSNCQDCHAAVANDARSINIPSASHSVFCGGCHGMTHD